MSEAKGDKKRWFPLESNPDVMNKYIKTLGVTNPDDKLFFSDVFGTDPELLMMVPQPVTAVLLLYPITDQNHKHSTDAIAGSKAVADSAAKSSFFIKQTISNACGTIGLLHALANSKERLQVQPGSFIEKFVRDGVAATPEERAALLATDEKLEKAQATAAQEGQTHNQSIEAKIDLHFVCFIHHDGQLLEMDGRHATPVPHGACTPETLLANATQTIQGIMKLNPEQHSFGIVAMTAEPLEKK